MPQPDLNKLHVRLLNIEDGEYNEKIGVLYLNKAQSFIITIAEYDDELNTIKKEFDEKREKINNQKTNLDKQLAEERKKSLDFIYKSEERHKRGEISTETHNANIDARERSMDERTHRDINNQQKQKQQVEALTKQEKTKIESLNEKYKSIRWINQLTGNKPPKYYPSDFNSQSGLGRVVIEYDFKKFLEGGGAIYLEPFFDGDMPQSKPPYGIYVQADGTPDILGAIWEKSDGEMIPSGTPIAFGSSVYLSVFTSGLYGRNLKIELKDRNSILAFFTQGYVDVDKKLHAIEREAETTAKGDEIVKEDKEWFTRPVDVHLQKDIGKEPKTVKKGLLVVNNGEPEAGHSKTYVQKCYFRVYIDPLWKSVVRKELKIYPIIYHPFTGKVMKNFVDWDEKLSVSSDSKALQLIDEKPKSNQVVVLNNIETNIATFTHCRYDSIVLRDMQGKKEVVVFDVDIPELRKRKTLDIDIIAGKKKQYYIDFDLKTIECLNEPSHYNKEFKIVSLPETYTHTIDEESYKEQEKAPEGEKEIDEIIVIGKEPKSKNKIEISGASQTSKQYQRPTHGEVIVGKDRLSVDAFYYYDIPENSGPLEVFPMAMKYFWLKNEDNKIRTIKARAETCAFAQDINIRIFPDIKWTLQLGFNTSEEFIKGLNKKGIQTPLDSYRMEIDKANKQLTKEDKKYLDKNNHLKKIVYKEANDSRKLFKLPKKPKKKNKSDTPVKQGKIAVLLDVLQNMDLSLAETHYGGLVKNELSTEMIKKIWNTVEPMAQLIAEVCGIIDGDNDRDRISEKEKKSMQGLMAKLNRKPTEYTLVFPQFAFAGSWFYEEVDYKKLGRPDLAGRQGLGVHINLKADPLIGISITWDILELICRKHPIVYAVLKAVKTVEYMLDGSIKLDFVVTGQISTEIDFSYNKLAGFKNLEAMGKQALQAEIKLEASMTKTWNVWKYGVVAELGFGLEGKTGIGIISKFGLDPQGLYLQKILEFEGIDLKAELTAQVQVEKGEGEKPGISVGDTWMVEITLIPYTFETPKFYFTQK